MPSPLAGRRRVPPGFEVVVNGERFLPGQFLPAGTQAFTSYRINSIARVQRVLGGGDYITTTYNADVSESWSQIRAQHAVILTDWVARGAGSPKLRGRSELGRGWTLGDLGVGVHP